MWENTVVIFTSDHGDGCGAHQWNQKTALYEEVVNVPFIVCLPGGKNAGKVLPQFINNGEDLMPSVCDWAEVEVPSERQGVSFREVAEEGDTAKAHRPYVVTETFFGETAGTLGWMVRTPNYKYILYDTGKNRRGKECRCRMVEGLPHLDVPRGVGGMGNREHRDGCAVQSRRASCETEFHPEAPVSDGECPVLGQ